MVCIRGLLSTITTIYLKSLSVQVGEGRTKNHQHSASHCLVSHKQALIKFTFETIFVSSGTQAQNVEM